MSPEAAAYTENLITAQGNNDPDPSGLDGALTPEQCAKVFGWIEDREEDLTSGWGNAGLQPAWVLVCETQPFGLG